MSPLLSAHEIEAGLIRLGVPKDQARAEALRQIAPHADQRTDQTTATHPVYAPREELPQIIWPVRLLLPWSSLISDNRRYASGTERHGGGLLLTRDYRRCRGLIRDRVLDTIGRPAPEPVAIPLAVTAAVWVPDNHPHDCTNFAKCAHDAMERLIYTNDRWIYSAHWYRAGVDVDAPRCELTITPLLKSAA